MLHDSGATAGRLGLDAIAAADGTFSIVALDQRNTLRRMFAAVGQTVEPAQLRDFKVDVCAALTPAASAILLDPDYGVPAAREAGAVADGCGILVAAEPSERSTWNGEPRATRDPALNAAWVRDLGGSALKFLVQLRPDRPRAPDEPDLVAELLDVVRQVVDDCRTAGIPSVIENLVYNLPGEDQLAPRQRADAIVEAARMLDEAGPDLLKLEYPGSAQDCRRIAEALHRPWAVLSAGVAFDEFTDVLRIACDDGGASGFIAGRAFWKDAVGMDPAGRRQFLATVGRRRLDDCVAAIRGRARPWHEALAQRR